MRRTRLDSPAALSRRLGLRPYAVRELIRLGVVDLWHVAGRPVCVARGPLLRCIGTYGEGRPGVQAGPARESLVSALAGTKDMT